MYDEIDSLAINLAGKLIKNVMILPSQKICGGYNIRDIETNIEITILDKWRETPPLVSCLEPWVKKSKDWHVYETGHLCYVHNHEWKVFFELPQHNIDHAVNYLFRNVTYLLDKHILADIYNIDQWNPEWSQYLHGNQSLSQVRKWEREFRRTYTVTQSS